MSETKPGMGSWSEEDIRRFAREDFIKLQGNQQSPVASEATPEELDYNASYHPTD